MKKISTVFLIILSMIISLPSFASGEQDFAVTKQNIILLYNANKLKEAYQLISNIPENQRDEDIWLLAANITQDYGRDTDAEFLLQKAIKTSPKSYKPYYNLANLYFSTKRYNTAIAYYKTSLKYKKDFAYAWYNIGCSYLALEDFSKAKSAFMRAISFKTDEANFYYNLAFAYKKLNKQKQSEKMLKIYDSLKANPN